MTNAAWLAAPSVRVNPSSQRASNVIATARPQRQLESLSPHGLGNLLDQYRNRHLFRLFFFGPRSVRE